MPRPKRPGGPPPKTRSRNGCRPCKTRKVKCDETRPCCKNCAKISKVCDYSLTYTWLMEGTKKGGKNNFTAWESGNVEVKGFEDRFETISANGQGFHSQSPEYPAQKRRHFDSTSPSRQSTDDFLSPPTTDLFPGPASPFDLRTTNSPERTPKRNRVSLSSNDSQQEQMPPPQGVFAAGLAAPQGLATSPFSPFSVSTSSFGSSSPTPAPSSETSEDHLQKSPRIKADSNQMYDGRLSVKSLLGSSIEYRFQQKSFPGPHEDSEQYGFDIGAADKDYPANDDDNAITQSVCTLIDDGLDMVPDLTSDEVGVIPPKEVHQALGHAIYYSQPVPIKIPNSLGALPSLLSEKPMNLLYFHHFINHTARILVPHNCSENPFITLLPQMAFSDSNLLKLLLSYSASHRARLVGQASPRTRIALWTENVFPALRHALKSSAPISNANLATAIMLTSLEIISPGAFGHPIPWQKHLGQAREMFVRRGGADSVSREDKISYFLSCWLAYLDIMGSLGGVKNDKPLFNGPYWTETDENTFQVDCLLGFTSHSAGTLARIAELARKCDIERLELGPIKSATWKPSPATIVAAENLRAELEHARTYAYEPCPHLCSTFDSENAQNSLEMIATNDAFHWAGLINIRRRILGSPRNDSEVQNALRQIISSLYKIRKGGTAEACLLFPMFTAACEAEDDGQRVIISERLDCIGQVGMTQPKKAKALVKRVWETGMRWETLADGEFLA